MSKIRYWIAVASKEHVDVGVEDGIAQFCHGKLGPAKRVSKGDWVVYYSSKLKLNEAKPCQMFTAIGTVSDDAPYQFEMSPSPKPYRRKIKYKKCKAVEIKPLIPALDFIKDKKHWGAIFRYGLLEIDQKSFDLIASTMLNKNVAPPVPDNII